MLFSEPKIPQHRHCAIAYDNLRVFQCSSASRKFLNGAAGRYGARGAPVSVLFSEPKIPQLLPSLTAILSAAAEFQCSSASRKFLNDTRASRCNAPKPVSVLFSEPKIPQQACIARNLVLDTVSVLFSEPKIPQLFVRREPPFGRPFQCSSASRKFLNSSN